MEANGDGVRVVVAGEIDVASVPQLALRLNEAVASSEKDVVVDLADVTFMDSTGLALLAKTRAQLASDGRRLFVARPATCVRRLFALAGVDQLFDVQDLDDREPA